MTVKKNCIRSSIYHYSFHPMYPLCVSYIPLMSAACVPMSLFQCPMSLFQCPINPLMCLLCTSCASCVLCTPCVPPMNPLSASCEPPQCPKELFGDCQYAPGGLGWHGAAHNIVDQGMFHTTCHPWRKKLTPLH